MGTPRLPSVDSDTYLFPDSIIAAQAKKFGRAGSQPAALSNTTAAQRFNPELATYNWKPSNTVRFRAALGKAMAGAATCEIVCMGESTTAGRSLTNTEQAYPAYLRKSLASRGLPLSGNGAVFPGRGDNSVNDAFTTITGTWNYDRNLYLSSSTAGAQLTITGSGTTLTLLSSNYGSGSFTYAVDGGAAVTVSNTGASTLQATTVNSLSAGQHTVVITQISGNITFYYAKFAATTGVTVNNAGSSGSTVVDYWNTSQFYNALAASMTLNPHLVLIGLTINDLAAGRSASDFKAALLSTVTLIKATSDVAICTSNAATGSWTDAQFVAYNQAMYEIADQLDIPLIDVTFRFPSYTANNAAGLMIDTYHPNASYYAERGNHHARVLTSI